MEGKKELITETLKKFLQAARKFSHIESLPIAAGTERDITTREAHIIQTIGDNENLNVTGLARFLGVTRSAASQMVSKLTEPGFVRKYRAPFSNKEYFLSLTETGWRIYHAHEEFHGRDMNTLIERLNGFSITQIAAISVLLEVINEAMDERISSSILTKEDT